MSLLGQLSKYRVKEKGDRNKRKSNVVELKVKRRKTIRVEEKPLEKKITGVFKNLKRGRRRREEEFSIISLKRFRLAESFEGFTYAYNLNGVIAVWIRGRKLGKWKFLEPLVLHPEIYEISLRGTEISVLHEKYGRLKVAYADYNVTLEKAAKLVSSLAALSLARVDFEKPTGYGEMDGWRLFVKLELVSGEPELKAVKIRRIPEITEWCSHSLAAKILVLSLMRHGIVIYGPPGSGKTTFLNSMLNAILRLFNVEMSVVETVPELVLPKSSNIHRTYVSSVEDTYSLESALRDAFRFERPSIIVLGELRGNEIKSWIDSARSSVPLLTTVHARGFRHCVSTLESILDAAGIRKFPLLENFRVFVHVTRKDDARGRVWRWLEEVVFYKDGKLVWIYKREKGEVEEWEFLQALENEYTILGPASELYKKLKLQF